MTDPSYKLTTIATCRRELAADFDDDMVQDAMAIILFPTKNAAGVFSSPLCHHYRSWRTKKLPNPLRRPDDKCDKTPPEDLVWLCRLHGRLLLFIEDYPTKATSANPSREYLGLSPLSLHSRDLTYLGHPLSPRSSAANLTGPERRRFFRAFLRYELLCKWCASDSLGDSSWYYYLSSLWRYRGRVFRVVEAEAIACVRFYVESLHKAITTQCELHEESQCVVDHLRSDLSYFGLDLAAALLQAATAGKQGREHVRMCWHGLYERRPQDDYSLAFKDCILGYDPLRERDEHYTEGPGMYRMLYPIALSSAMQRYLYRRKAWAFFDDIRLHPARLQHVCFTDADWGDVERLHSLHDRPIDEYPHSPEMQTGYPAPPFWQGNRFVGLDPFWQ